MISWSTELAVVLAQTSGHIIGTCGGKQRCLTPAKTNHMGMGAINQDKMLIFDVSSIAQVTGRVGLVVPGLFQLGGCVCKV